MSLLCAVLPFQGRSTIFQEVVNLCHGVRSIRILCGFFNNMGEFVEDVNRVANVGDRGYIWIWRLTNNPHF